jgi:hypothetical protein
MSLGIGCAGDSTLLATLLLASITLWPLLIAIFRAEFPQRAARRAH